MRRSNLHSIYMLWVQSDISCIHSILLQVPGLHPTNNLQHCKKCIIISKVSKFLVYCNECIEKQNTPLVRFTALNCLSFYNMVNIVKPTVRIMDGNSEIYAHVNGNICFLICVRHVCLDREQSQIGILFPKRPHLPSCVGTCSKGSRKKIKVIF